MNADLERDLREAGDGLRDIVSALRRAPQAHVEAGFAARVLAHLPREGGFVRFRTRWLSPSMLFAAAASILAVFAFVSLVLRPVPKMSVARLAACQRGDGSFSDSSAAQYVQAFAVTVLARDPSSDRAALDRAVDALVRTQDASGGWGNAALSARNVAALAQAESAGVVQARAARRRGLRYLRMHGVGEISAGELVREAKDAFARIGQSRDDGLVCSTALAGRL